MFSTILNWIVMFLSGAVIALWLSIIFYLLVYTRKGNSHGRGTKVPKDSP